MTDLHIVRQHTLGLREARRVAYAWAEHVEEKFGMTCTYEEGRTQDEVCFKRAGVDGTLVLSKDRFELSAKLGFLLGAFKSSIEREIVKNLDDLLTPTAPAAGRVSKKK